MRHVNSTIVIAFTAVAAPPLAGVVPAQTAAPGAEIVAHTVDFSSRHAALGLELSDGRQLRISLARGVVSFNRGEVGRYTPGGPLETSWRNLLEEAASLSTPGLRTRMAAWKVSGLPAPDAEVKRRIDDAFRTLPARAADEIGDEVQQAVEEAVTEATTGTTARAIARAISQAEQPRAATASRGLGDVSSNLAGLFGMVVALSCIAFGLVSFAPRQLEAVSDMVRRSFIRSFFTGLFAQPLLLPVLGMLTVGLALTIVGIIAIPVAIIGFVLAVGLGLVGGYVALARAFGEILLRRRGGDGSFATGTTPYKASVVGLVGLLAIWAPFALFSWVPVVNWILLWCAIVFTWIMATAGFGATILSRGGLRQSFVRPELPGFSGEFSWTGEMEAHRAAMKELE